MSYIIKTEQVTPEEIRELLADYQNEEELLDYFANAKFCHKMYHDDYLIMATGYYDSPLESVVKTEHYLLRPDKNNSARYYIRDRHLHIEQLKDDGYLGLMTTIVHNVPANYKANVMKPRVGKQVTEIYYGPEFAIYLEMF